MLNFIRAQIAVSSANCIHGKLEKTNVLVPVGILLVAKRPKIAVNGPNGYFSLAGALAMIRSAHQALRSRNRRDFFEHLGGELSGRVAREHQTPVEAADLREDLAVEQEGREEKAQSA